MMRVVDHIEEDLLIHKGLNHEENEVFKYMVYGRTVHQFIQLILPEVQNEFAIIVQNEIDTVNQLQIPNQATNSKRPLNNDLEFNLDLVKLSHSESNTNVSLIESIPRNEELLVLSSQIMFECWLKSEEKIFGYNSKFEWDRNFLKGLFKEIIVSENRGVQVEDNYDRRKNLYKQITKSQSYPLSKELVSYWYRGWNRYLVIFNSKFDYVNRISDIL